VAQWLAIRNSLTALGIFLCVFAVVVTGLAQRPEEKTPAPSPYDKHLLELDRVALDAAYQTQLTKLFGVWMSDEHGQPQRAIVGANRARRAYIGVMREIEAREGKMQ
jgi:hypothetical protein